MQEPLFNSLVPDTYYGPMEGQGEWSLINYDEGVAGILWTNTAQALMILRTDYTEKAVPTLESVEDTRRKYMSSDIQPYDAFLEMSETSISSGLLEKDLVTFARSLTVYDPDNTAYYKSDNDVFKITDNQTFIRIDSQWSPVEDYSVMLNKDLIEILYSECDIMIKGGNFG